MFGAFRPEIERALDPAKWPMAWLEQQVEVGAIAIMRNDTAIIGVERRHYPGGLVELHGMFAAGAVSGILELVESACAAGRLAGCGVATIASRPAWAHILKGRGFRVDQVSITKDLTDGV